VIILYYEGRGLLAGSGSTGELVLHVLVTSLHAVHETLHLSGLSLRASLLGGLLGAGLVGAGKGQLVGALAGSNLVHTLSLGGNTLAVSRNSTRNSAGALSGGTLSGGTLSDGSLAGS